MDSEKGQGKVGVRLNNIRHDLLEAGMWLDLCNFWALEWMDSPGGWYKPEKS